jgi:CO dehydrogenase/acetyl-CoA synthase alpha subunit
MQAIADLQNLYFRTRLGLADIQPCIDWAIERVQSNEEGDNLDVVLLAAASSDEDVSHLVEKILSRYVGGATLDEELAAGKFVAELYEAYLEKRESIQSLDDKDQLPLLQPWLSDLACYTKSQL